MEGGGKEDFLDSVSHLVRVALDVRGEELPAIDEIEKAIRIIEDVSGRVAERP